MADVYSIVPERPALFMTCLYKSTGHARPYEALTSGRGLSLATHDRAIPTGQAYVDKQATDLQHWHASPKLS